MARGVPGSARRRRSGVCGVRVRVDVTVRRPPPPKLPASRPGGLAGPYAAVPHPSSCHARLVGGGPGVAAARTAAGERPDRSEATPPIPERSAAVNDDDDEPDVPDNATLDEGDPGEEDDAADGRVALARL